MVAAVVLMEEPRVGMVRAIVFAGPAHGGARLARRLLQRRHPLLDVLQALVSRGSSSFRHDQHQLLEDGSPLQQEHDQPPLAPCPPKMHNLDESQLAEDDLVAESDVFVVVVLVLVCRRCRRAAASVCRIAGKLQLH